MSGITRLMNIKMGERGSCLLDQEKKLSSAQKQQMQCLCGEDSSMEAGNAASTAPYSETKVTTDPAISYAKRMQLLMRSGLVAGITPTSTRKGSSQLTLDFASSRLDGGDAEKQKEG